MLQPDDTLPEAPACPAPWRLSGSGWIVAMRLPEGSPARTAFLDASIAGELRSPFALLMYVDYAASPCGPYRELLLIPGHVPFEDGRRHYTISRIVVSTWASVVNGRRNWGIPKDRADFDVATIGGEERIRVRSDDGREMCELRFARRTIAPRLPVPGPLIPSGMRTLAQRYAGCSYYYAPGSSGWVRPGKLVGWSFDAALFPDLRGAAILAALQVDSFDMTFPLARVATRV